MNKKLQWEENWQTTAGAWIPGKRVVMHGERIMETMQGKTWMEMILFAITGKKPNPLQARLLDEVQAFIGCFPDPRLWNNRIAALAGTARSTGALAISAATAASEAIVYGFQPGVGALKMFREIITKLENGDELQNILNARLEAVKNQKEGKPGKGKKRAIAGIPGYGRPLKKADERFPPILAVLKKYKADEGAAIKLAFAIERKLDDMGLELRLNAAGLVAALGVDQQLKEQEFLHYITFWFYPGLIACFDEAAGRPEASFFPMRCQQIEYKGEITRQWRAPE